MVPSAEIRIIHAGSGAACGAPVALDCTSDGDGERVVGKAN